MSEVHVEPKLNAITSVLVSGWSDNGWLSGGHAVRMAAELCRGSSDDLQLLDH